MTTTTTCVVVGDGGGACNDYRVDTLASAFGLCKCGFAKADHQLSAVRHGKPPPRRPVTPPLPAKAKKTKKKDKKKDRKSSIQVRVRS